MKKLVKILSVLLALALIVGMIPASALTVFAAGKAEVAQIETRISAEYVPYAGRDYTDLYTYDDSDIYGAAGANPSEWWVDDAGVTIEEKGNGDYGEWYDIRYQFEAGRTYTAVYTYMINTIYEDTYKFTENTTVTLTNPDPSKCTITGEVIEVRSSGRICDVRYTMTIAGERSYPDIETATLQKIAAPADGVQAETTALMYSNCTLTSQSWSPNVGTFEAGNTYTLTVNLRAKDGYKFADDFAPVLGIKGYEKAADTVELMNSNKDAAVSFTYSVGNYTLIDTLELEPISNAANYFPVAGESARYFPDLFEPVDGAPYEKEWLSSRQWYNEDDGKNMEQGDIFEAGKTYSYHSIFKIKTENEGTHRFASPTVQLGNFIYQNDVQTEVTNDPLRLAVTFTYTCRFPKGVGDSAGNPAVCHTYNEFKYVMENENIRYVALANVNETLPVGKEGLVTAIQVKGIKNLQLLGDATFTAPAMTQTTYAALLHTTSTYNTTLNISGAGSLTFKAVANSSYNAVIYNQGGSVNVDSGTLVGSYNTAVYGSAIWQEYGELRITGGNFNADNAIAPLSLPTPMSAVIVYGGEASISGGTFRTRNWVDTIDLPYGLQIGKNATVDLSGGTYYGILLPSDSTPLANYMDEDFYTALTDESKFNPASVYSQEYTASGNVVRIAWFVNHVDVHVNAPMAGVDITENYFNIPTSGCQATMYYPQWYKNGEPVTYGTFEAGASYKVVVQIEVKPGYGAEFADSVTAAVNNNAVTIKKTSLHWIEIEYDFGVCPNVISLVELTATAPKEGQKPSYTIGLGSDAYKLVGNYNNYKDYRQWYMSSDGDEWWPINETHTFMSGYYYKLYVDIQTASGYEFPLYDNGTIQPDVSATVNGYYARVIKAYDQDPSTYITVEYDFGICNDSIVEQIAVVDVTAPVAGERPNYTYNILGSGYQMNTAKNAYYDDYMHNQKLYYIKNGIGWYDLTEEDWVYEHETFIPGHEYRAYVYLITEDGYEFAYTAKYYENAVTATMNGNTAEVEIWDGYWAGQRRVKYTFTCEKKDVSTIMIYDLDAPQGDKIPDRDITTAYPELYTVEYVTWYDCEDNMLLDEDTFRSGERYKVEIKIVPTQIGGVNASQFVSPVKAYIDGQEVTERLNWDAVYAKSDAVYVYYTFIKSASAPEIGSFVSGTITSGGDNTSPITVQLIPEGLSEATYETIVYGNSANYYFAGVTPGTYDIKVTKADHDEFVGMVKVTNDNVMYNVTLKYNGSNGVNYGDVNGDGKINGRDFALLLQYINGWEVTIDKAAADANGDGKITCKDYAIILQYINGWPVTLGPQS